MNITEYIFLPSKVATRRARGEAKGTLFRRKDGKYLLYIPVYLAEDSMFPFKANPSVKVKISFKLGDRKLSIEKWEEETEA